MAIDDIPRIGKIVKAADKAADVARAAKAGDELVEVVRLEGVAYRFPKGTKRVDAERYLWNNVVKPRMQGKEEKIELPSELPSERQKHLEGADIIPLKKAGPRWDSEEGMGAVPNTMETDFAYLNGFVREMTPEQFLDHTPPIMPDFDTRYDRLAQGYAEGKNLSPPYLNVKWDPKYKVWRVLSHEGRHRSHFIRKEFGRETKMPVRIVPEDENGFRYKGDNKLTEEQKKAPIVGVGAAAGMAIGDTNNEDGEK